MNWATASRIRMVHGWRASEWLVTGGSFRVYIDVKTQQYLAFTHLSTYAFRACRFQAYLGRRRFRGASDGEAAAWLYAIARRQLSRYFRTARVERRALERLGLEPPALEDGERARIEELAALDDMRVALRAALGRLPQARRDALELRVIEELPHTEVAGRLGVSEQTARARVSRGLRALAAGLESDSQVEETPA